MSDPIDMVQLVKELPSRARGRACIVLTHDYAGQREWSAELARQTDSDHIDLLELFAMDETLCKEIERFSVPHFFDFLKDRGRAPVMIVSGMEFLRATWTGQARATEQFARRVETWDQAPCLLFVLQHDKNIATRPFRRHVQYMFVVDQKETFAL
jgi:hypothetical protein